MTFAKLEILSLTFHYGNAFDRWRKKKALYLRSYFLAQCTEVLNDPFSNKVAVSLLFLDMLSFSFFLSFFFLYQISRELTHAISVRLLFVRVEQPKWHAKQANIWRLCRQGMAVPTSARVKEGRFAPQNVKPRSHWLLCGKIAMEKLLVFWEQIIQCLGIRVLEHTST